MPLEYPCWSRKRWCPFTAVSEQCVGEEEELSHDGGDGDFGGFASRFELLVFCLEFGIEAHCDERGHIERLSDIGSSAADEGATGPLSGLPCDGREAG